MDNIGCILNTIKEKFMKAQVKFEWRNIENLRTMKTRPGLLKCPAGCWIQCSFSPGCPGCMGRG